jgi:hypothetical protein
MNHAAELLTPHTRGLIVRALESRGLWCGKRGSLRLTFQLLAQPDLEGRRVAWKVRIGKQVHKGLSADTWHAEQEIASLPR